MDRSSTGLIKSGSVGVPDLHVPAAYRPVRDKIFDQHRQQCLLQVDVKTMGTYAVIGAVQPDYPSSIRGLV